MADALKDFVADAALTMSKLIRGQVLLVVIPESDRSERQDPLVSFVANLSGVAYMMEGAAHVVTTHVPRPDNCEHCAAAWDRLVEARIQLDPPPGETNHKMHGH